MRLGLLHARARSLLNLTSFMSVMGFFDRQSRKNAQLNAWLVDVMQL
jgi:hypothetical protein